MQSCASYEEILWEMVTGRRKGDLLYAWEFSEQNDMGTQMCTSDVHDWRFLVTGAFWIMKFPVPIVDITCQLDMLWHFWNLLYGHSCELGCGFKNKHVLKQALGRRGSC